ncbi:UDP-3-O-(3-hydroxymyristoyl)glucosamine N-acyltransferase [Lacisediminimonas sp.]|uniref:UDP-3-O-(3-hydroxymyristoyl)glucosamine N-acyltransferase n=1 Tax=Lacisediminimonas sp. TaxID=3060582 RepID=UPI002718B161|nr:UDP-3-O-(3-hydroxymyristoyl)glucosamine N-acyltransferase [Lacisediminimonas sp.]MDO8299259.1 UDP-3-O-(3-hydroxymyristoyl)glucosamine N-acyltransferase [Lacisediminimonas sp.]MDO9219274.1 UDP-3-O-(3-hydroxymyristoyl)glucosamine N-acyltransferase [Lacisediminimonas sp.]
MSTSIGELVGRLGGELVGSPALPVAGIAPIDIADASQVAFLSNRKFREQARSCRASVLVMTAADSEAVGAAYTGARVLTPNPYAWFARAAQYFAACNAVPIVPGIHPTAAVDPAARVAATACIGPHVTIEAGAEVADDCVLDSGCFIGRDARIGRGTHFFARVTFHARCQIGERGIVHSGAVIGGDGFGFASDAGAWIKIPQTGRVVLGDDVQVGSNTTIDRGALADTVIEDGVKLDNQIQIAHNCHIGAHTAMAGCVGVAGSATIGKHCTFGGAAMVLGHLTIADNVHVSSGSLVSRSLHEAGQYTGFYPLAKNADWEKSAAIVRNLESMRDKVRELEKAVKEIKAKKEET